ncbi:unnamed protein product [Closterium sp. Yama58-4]|nr:unnamed protein product [Closterium sp. Yama58-4]
MDYAMEDHRRPRRSLQLDQLERPSDSGDEVCSGQSLATKTTIQSTLGAATATATTGLQRPQTAAGIMKDPFPPGAAYFPARDRGAADYMNVDEPARFGATSPWNFGAAAPAAAPAAARADTKAFAPPVPPAASRRVRANSATLPGAFGGEQGAAEWVDWSNVDCAFRPDGLMQARAAMIEQCRQNSRRAAMGASARAGRREAGIALGGARGKGEGRHPLLAGVSGEEQETARRVLELADRSLASYSVLHSAFLSPASQAAIMPILSNMADVTAILSGGYFQAERCRISVGPPELMAAEGVGADVGAAAADGTIDEIPSLAAGYPGAVAAVRVSGAFKQTSVSHGDFLGAVLGTGITRDKVGDVILLEGEGAQVIISPDLQDFLLSALTAVHRVPVTVQPIALSDLSVSPPRIDTLRTVEASLRLDAVASAAFRLSRSKFTELIAKGDVRVNWREAAKSGVVLKTGDVVSVRGKGRCKIGEVTTTKKGRGTIAMAEPSPALPSQTAMVLDEGSQPVDLVKHPSGIVPVLQNIVSTVNMDCRLDLKEIALRARNAEYNPKRFAAVIIRIREPKTTALVFASGKMVCTGAKSEEQSRLAARKYARIIQKLGNDQVKFKDFKIQNIVGSCDVRFPIRLEGLQIAHQQFCSYEPELFPGLIYRMKQPKIVLLIFVSGKIVLTGAKVRDEIYQAFENIYPVLNLYRKIQAEPLPPPAES